MGKTADSGPELFDCLKLGAVTVWKSRAVQPMSPEGPITLDLSRLLFFKPRLVLKNAR
jgi:hypothetical protein